MLYHNSAAGKDTDDVKSLSANIIHMWTRKWHFSVCKPICLEFPWVKETCKRLGGIDLSKEEWYGAGFKE